MPSAISVRKLTRRFGTFTAVDAIDLEVPEGALYGFLGLNGAGKSTTIRMLCGLLPPTEGRAIVAGYDVVERTVDVRRRVGLLAELDAAQAHPSWTGEEYLRYFGRLWELPNPDARARGLLDQVGLEPAWRRRPMRAYSTGMRRRIEIARAMLGSPRILLLDEPTRGLDIPAKRDLWAWLRDIASKQRMTVFLSSHDVREIRALCQELAVIAAGKIAYRGSVRQLGRNEDELEEALVKLFRAETRETATTPGHRAAGAVPPRSPTSRRPIRRHQG